MNIYADMDCVLKVNIHCDACKMKMIEVLSSICGVYSVSIDAQEGTAKVSGEVDPKILLRVLGRSDKHAELVWVKIKHPTLHTTFPPNSSSYYSHNNNYLYGPSSYPYGALVDKPSSYYDAAATYGNSRPYGLPDQQSYENYHPQTRQLPYNSVNYEYPSSYSTNYRYDSPVQRAHEYVPSAPQPVYDAYDNYESVSFCSIL